MFGGYADLVYQFGMADENQRDYIQKVSDEAVQMITQGNFLGAFKVRGKRERVWEGERKGLERREEWFGEERGVVWRGERSGLGRREEWFGEERGVVWGGERSGLGGERSALGRREEWFGEERGVVWRGERSALERREECFGEEGEEMAFK